MWYSILLRPKLTLVQLQNAVEQPPRFAGRWTGTFVINTFVVVWVLVVGFGFGGWASMTNFVRQIDTFGLFTKCYHCPAPMPMPSAAPGTAWPFPGGFNNFTMLPPAPAPSPAHFLHHHRHHSHGL